MSEFPLIESNPEVLVGKPVFKGTRIPVSLIISMLSKGFSNNQIFEHYPNLTKEHLSQALGFSSKIEDFNTVAYDYA